MPQPKNLAARDHLDLHGPSGLHLSQLHETAVDFGIRSGLSAGNRYWTRCITVIVWLGRLTGVPAELLPLQY